MYKLKMSLCLFLLPVFFIWVQIPFNKIENSGETFTNACFAQSKSEEQENQEEKDIRWFREEMKISPKYMEKKEGILGMSRTHFFTMLFLIIFFIGTIVSLLIRRRRTKQLLDLLLKEERHGADS